MKKISLVWEKKITKLNLIWEKNNKELCKGVAKCRNGDDELI